MSYYEENAPKGEYVLVVAGAAPKTGAVVTLEDGVAQVLALKEQGMRLKDAAKEVAEHTGLSKTSCTPPPWSGKGKNPPGTVKPRRDCFIL